MKFSALVVTFLFAAFQVLPPLVGPLDPGNSGVISGIVRSADTRRPIPDAQVALMKSGETIEQAMERSVVTDSGGRFTIKSVSEGEFKVVAQAEGFFSPADDGPRTTVPAWVARDVILYEGIQINGVVLELIPGSVISGRVAAAATATSAGGRRLANATVEALQPDYVSGRLTLTPVETTLTDDLGEYRLFWVPAGDYYVRARYRLSGADRSERYAPLFFPSIADEEIAPLLSLSPGSESSAIDFRVETTPIAGVTVSGRVSSPDLVDMRVASVYLVPRGRTVTLMADASDAIENESPEPADGAFLIRGVPPGTYDLFPVVKDGDGNLRAARIPVDVEERNIDGLSAPVSAVVELSGRITLDGRAPPPETWIGAAVLTSLDGLPGVLLNSSSEGGGEVSAQAKVDPETGGFVFPRVSPGRYALRLAAPLDPAGAYLADVRLEDKSVFDSGFVVGEEAPRPLELIVQSRGATVAGTVLNSTLVQPFAGATVALVPENPRRRNLVLYRTAVSAQDGTFTLMGVAPGDYKVFAWQTVARGAWENAAFLRRYEDQGVALNVEANSEKSVRVRVISR